MLPLTVSASAASSGSRASCRSDRDMLRRLALRGLPQQLDVRVMTGLPSSLTTCWISALTPLQIRPWPILSTHCFCCLRRKTSDLGAVSADVDRLPDHKRRRKIAEAVALNPTSAHCTARTHSLTHSLTHTYAHTRSLAHSFTRLLPHSLTRLHL